VSLDPVVLEWDQLVQPVAPGGTRVVVTSLPAGSELTLSLAMPESVVCGVR
jgi:hypothetical protein